jgi:hypothetical protein
MQKALPASLLALVACSFACSAAPPSSGFQDKPAGSENGFGEGNESGSLGSSDGTAAESTGANTAGCSEEAKQVYVVSEQYDLHRFEPDKLAFTKIGRLACPANGATPNSMAVDRSGTAWVNYSDGRLFKVSTKDATCTATAFQPGQAGMIKFGMAFASNAAGSQDETLFVSGIQDSMFGGAGKGLAKIDLSTLKLTPVSDYDGALTSMGAELTGTGDGRLYGFFTTFPDATLARIEKASATTSENRPLEGVFTGTAWAFSFWGGDFWFYTSSGQPSSVTRLRVKTGEIEVVKPDVGGFRIVGAGVSTCAPLTSGPR